MKTIFLNTGLFFVLFMQSLSGIAQNDEAMLEQSIKNDTAINAIALYPLELRTSILKVCSEPQGLVKMEDLQKNSKERFQKILSGYPQEEQKKLWDLVRYPGLIEKLANEGDGKKKKIEIILKDFPKDIHETALKYGDSHHKVIKQIDELDKKIQTDFIPIIQNYPPELQTAFRQVLAHPEVIELLGKNMKMTVLWGDVYKRDPKLVKSKLDALGTDLATKNAKSVKDWKEGLEKDPKAKKEFEESAKEYAKEQGYTDAEVMSDPGSVNVYVYPYPYWYGTPWWWDYPRWYPYPYWYDWGYYYGPGGGIVYIGYPSWYFTNWYFYHPYHHHQYSYFSDYCVDHYYGHRNSYTPVHRSVSGWVNDNRDRLPSDFATNKTERPDRLREFGKAGIKAEPKSPGMKGEPKGSDRNMEPIKPVDPDKTITSPSEPRIKNSRADQPVINEPSAPKQKAQPRQPKAPRNIQQPKPNIRQQPMPAPKQQAPPRRKGGR